MKRYWDIFRITFSISAFTFGGGYIVIPLMRRYFVEGLAVLSDEELMDMAAVAQSTPGAIAVNLAVLIGYRVGGIAGAILACLGTIMPPIVILSVIALFYKQFRDNRIVGFVLKGMEAGVAATIVDLLIDMSRTIFRQRNWLLTLLVPLTFVASFIFRINVFLIIVLTAVVCVGQSLLMRRKAV